MQTVLAVVPVVSVVLTGLFAGLFFAFSVAVMPGLRRVGDRVMIETMQGINVAILNPLFALVFLGAPVAALVTVVLYATGGAWAAAGWAAVAAAALVAVLVVTFAANIPRNNALEEAGPAENVADPAAVRGAFETVWGRWNHVRSWLSAVALVCGVVAVGVG
ncbi:anthrone oxygenase family protein [Nocardiopsis sp. NPDC049922]|uniref:anthrone oxygenase family protein n=1 Tax=Nocardiopsis sp. NPDC049922 TaxID=3155157 RepID=UPI0033FF570A